MEANHNSKVIHLMVCVRSSQRLWRGCVAKPPISASPLARIKEQLGNTLGSLVVLGSFLVPEIDVIFGDGVGASLVRGPYCQPVLV